MRRSGSGSWWSARVPGPLKNRTRVVPPDGLKNEKKWSVEGTLLRCNPASDKSLGHSVQSPATSKIRIESHRASWRTQTTTSALASPNECTTEVSAHDALVRHTRTRSRSRVLGVHSTYRGCCARLVSQSSLMEFAMSRVLWRICEERPSRASVHGMHEWILSNDTFPWTQLSSPATTARSPYKWKSAPPLQQVLRKWLWRLHSTLRSRRGSRIKELMNLHGTFVRDRSNICAGPR